jgi:hypothetical protein
MNSHSYQWIKRVTETGSEDNKQVILQQKRFTFPVLCHISLYIYNQKNEVMDFAGQEDV